MRTNCFIRSVVSAAVLSAGMLPVLAQADSAVVNDRLPYSSVVTELPKLDAPFLRDGVVVPPSNIRQVQPGLTQDQVRALLGEPVAQERDGQALQWDYNLKLRTGEQRRDYLVCQYKVLFGQSSDVVTGTAWRRPQCKALAEQG